MLRLLNGLVIGIVLLSRNLSTNEMNNTIGKTMENKSYEEQVREQPLSQEETNFTKMATKCVGDSIYCNLTREEYTKMIYDYIYPKTYEWVLIAMHTVVFITGLVGNVLVCVAVYKKLSMRTVTNYFIVNLAVADFLVILMCLPPTVLWNVTETWFFGNAMCKIVLYLQSVSVTVSVLTLTFISVDRWYVICFPLKFKSTKGHAKVSILIIWMVSLTFNAPELVFLQSEVLIPLRFELDQRYLIQCVTTWSHRSDLIWHVIKLVLIYIIPLLLMGVAYYQIVKVLWYSQTIPGQAETAELTPAEKIQIQSRRNAAKMLAVVVIVFAVCYFPVHLLSILRYSIEIDQDYIISCLALIAHMMCYANSAIHPLIYNYMNGKFRHEFRCAFCFTSQPQHDHSMTLARMAASTRPDERRRRHQRGGNYDTAFF